MIYIWGTKEKSRLLKRQLYDIAAIRYVENDLKMWGKVIDEIEVVPPEKVASTQDKIYIVIPNYTINVVKAIYNQIIEDLGIEKENILIISDRMLGIALEKFGTIENIFLEKKKKIIFLNSIEYEAAHHCNLNCKGCNHFAPLSEAKYGQIKQFKSDLERMTRYVEFIEEIRLLGGEPLLNENLEAFIDAAHFFYPTSKIHILTNGLLIKKMSRELIECIKRNGAVVGVTIYPPVQKYLDEMISFLEKQQIKYDIFGENNIFSGQINEAGDSDPEKTERQCQASSCHIIEDGKLVKCTVGHKLPVYFNYFNIVNSYKRCEIDLYDENLNARDMFDYLMTANDMCRYCGKLRLFDWKPAGKIPLREDWMCEK